METIQGLRLTVKTSQLTAGIKACAMARDKGRYAVPACSDYRLELEGNNLLIISTDRYKLIRVSISGENIAGTFDGLSVDGGQFDAIAAHKGASDTVTLDISENGVIATYLDETILRASNTGRDFPKYRFILEGDKGSPAAVIRFNPAYLADIGKACGFIVAKGGYVETCIGESTKPSTFTASNDGLAITALLMPMRINNINN